MTRRARSSCLLLLCMLGCAVHSGHEAQTGFSQDPPAALGETVVHTTLRPPNLDIYRVYPGHGPVWLLARRA